MAQTLQVRAIVRNSTTGGQAGSDSIAVTTTGNATWGQKGSVGTTEEEWTIGTEVGDAGYCVIRNYDATNYVQVGFATTVYNLRLKAGQSAVFPLEPATASLFLKANTAACVVQVEVVEA
jgi:hypothetical protein